MGKTPVVEPQKILRALQSHGFRLCTLKGSHANLVDGTNHHVTVPLHERVSPGTFLSISAQAGMEKDELARLVAG